MRRQVLFVLIGLVSMAALCAAQAEIPLPEGAVMWLGLSWITDVKFSPDGRYLAVGTSLGIELRDSRTIELVRTLPGHTGDVLSIAFTPDGSLLASGSADHMIKLWEVSNP